MPPELSGMALECVQPLVSTRNRTSRAIPSNRRTIFLAISGPPSRHPPGSWSYTFAGHIPSEGAEEKSKRWTLLVHRSSPAPARAFRYSSAQRPGSGSSSAKAQAASTHSARSGTSAGWPSSDRRRPRVVGEVGDRTDSLCDPTSGGNHPLAGCGTNSSVGGKKIVDKDGGGAKLHTPIRKFPARSREVGITSRTCSLQLTGRAS